MKYIGRAHSLQINIHKNCTREITMNWTTYWTFMTLGGGGIREYNCSEP